MVVDGSAAPDVSEVMLGAGEYGGELELLIESTETVTGCPRCGVIATAHGRREHLVRDVPSAGRPVTPVWRKRIWTETQLGFGWGTVVRAVRDYGRPLAEVAAAWCCAQALREVYHADTVEEGHRRGEQAITMMLSCPVPEFARLGRTLRSWRGEFPAYFSTDRASNGPTEAMNQLIEKIRRIGHGFRNLDNYRLRLLLYCGVDWHTAPT